MKKMNVKKIMKGMISSLIILCNLFAVSFVSYADINYPKEVTIEYDMNQIYTLTGKLKDGTVINTKVTPLFAVYDGIRQPVFCHELGIPIDNAITTGYKANPLPSMSLRARYISALWKYAGTDADTQVVTNSMIWGEINGLHDVVITKPDKTLLAEYQTIYNKISNVVDDYAKKPSFHNQTVKLIAGKPLTLTDTNNAGLSRFNKELLNSAKVGYNVDGNKITLTATKDSNVNGVLRFFKTIDVGTPVSYQLEGQQSVMAGAIDDPNGYQIPLEIIKNGKAQVQKLDTETGKPMAGVEFAVKDTKGNSLGKVKTDKNGIGLFDKELLHETEIYFEEIKTLEGYVLNTKPIKATIVAGETITVSMNNDTQKGRIEGNKVHEVYQQVESEDKGQSIYDKRPLGGVTIDIENVTDIKRPDGTIVSKAGEISDTVITEKDGGFKSTKDLYIGAQNKYKLVERDVPANYRPLYDEQAEFSIAYDAEKKTKVFTLDMKTLDNDLKTGGFELEKIDADTGKIIPNTEFLLRGLSAYNKDVLYTVVTGDELTTDKLIAGKYEIVEVKFADGYGQSQGESLTKVFEIKDNETTKLVVKNNKIIVEPKKPEIAIKTKAQLEDGTQYFNYGDVLKMYDNVAISHKNVLDGSKRAFKTILVARIPEGDKTKDIDIWESEKIDYAVSEQDFVQKVVTEKIDTGKYPKGTIFFFKERGFDENGKEDVNHNLDGKEQEQGIYPKEEPKKEVLKEVLPQTGEQVKKALPIIGLLLLIGVAGAIYLKNKKKESIDKEGE